MPFDGVMFPETETANIDRELEQRVARVMDGERAGEDMSRLGDLMTRRAELTEPAGFARIAKLLGV